MKNYGEGKQVSIRKLIEEDYPTYREVYAEYLERSQCRKWACMCDH